MSKWLQALLFAHCARAAFSSCLLVAGGAGFGSGAHQLGFPAALDLDPSGQLLVAERYNRRVTRWCQCGANSSTVARWDKEAAEEGSVVARHGSPRCAPPCETKGHGDSAGGGLDIAVRGHDLWVVRFKQTNFLHYDLRKPGTVVLSPGSNDEPFKVVAAGDSWYVMGFWPRTVRRYSPGSGGELLVNAGYGHGLDSFLRQTDLAVHASGDIYILEKEPARVTRWAPGAKAGELVVWCTNGSTLVHFRHASALAVDRDRNVYIADFALDRVAVWPPGAREGVLIAGGNGKGSALNQLNGPRALLLDGKGQLFIADEKNHRVLACRAPKIVTGTKGHVAPLVAVIVLFGALSVFSPLICICGGLAGLRKFAARLAAPRESYWPPLDWWCRGHSGKSSMDKSLLFRAFDALARIVMWFILATCFLWFAFAVNDCLWGWSDDQWVQLDDGEVLHRDIFSTGELCRGIAAPHRFAHPLWSWLLFAIHLAAALATVSPSIWLVSVAKNLHLRVTAILGLTNWALHAMTFMQDAKFCFGSRFTSKNRRISDGVDAVSQFAAGGVVCFAWLLVIFRLHALEQASWQRVTAIPLKCLLWVPAILVLYFTYITLQYWKLLHPRPDDKIKDMLESIWIPFLPLAFLGTVTLRGLVVARNLVRRATQCVPREQAERARRALANLEKQPPMILLAMATTLISVFLKGTRRNEVAPFYFEELRDEGPAVMILERFIMLLDAVTNTAAALLLSGVMHGAVEGASERAEAKRRRRRRWRKCTRDFYGSQGQGQPLRRQWNDAVAALANRGISLECLLQFWRRLPELMPHFDPERSTTNDVVRGAIIPLSAPCKGAASRVLMQEAARPDMMVTHNWGNLFAHLVAAVLADALGEGSYDKVARLLKQDLGLLEQWVEHFKVGSRCYWICAFCVNQHSAVCSFNHQNHRDTVTGKVYPLCNCGSPKIDNETEPRLPDGRSIHCEMNKFDDMMKYLSAGNAAFGQAIAVDLAFDIFTRAWCIAEIATAHQTGMEQHVIVLNQESVTQRSEALSRLRIEDMESSRPEDKEQIMASIEDVEAFNTFTRRLLLEDLFPKWASLDAEQHMEYVGNLIRWCQTFGWETRKDDQGTGAARCAMVSV